MRRLIACLLIGMLLAAGCLDGTRTSQAEVTGPEVSGQPSGESLGEGEYWIVWVEGEQHLDPPAQYICSVAYDHDIDVANRTLEYSNHTYDIDPANVTYVVAFDVWEPSSSCPTAYRLHPGLQPLSQAMGAFGNLTLEPAANGSIMLEPGTWLHPGQQASYTYEATKRMDGDAHEATGWFNVTHLGAWPQAGLGPAD